jgi:methanogenic corrinoid protein MtbC1
MTDARQAAQHLRAALEAHLADHDRDSAVADALASVEAGSIDVVTLYRDVLAPLMTETGAAWQEGRRAVWEEHLVSAAVRTIVEALYPRILADRLQPGPDSPTVVLACPPEEAHELGLRMASDLYALSGAVVYYLGADTPEDEIAAAVREVDADLIVMTASTHYHRLQLREIVDRLNEALPGAGVKVGGAAFASDIQGWDPDEIVDLRALAAQAARALEG